ncbi:MAG: glycine zipper 2TM domain-containing protein [Pseudomonadota bacterium]
MRKFIMAITLGATMLTAVPAVAQRGPDREYRQDSREARRDYRNDRRDAWRNYNRYDYNRPQPGQRRYFAENYYRDGRYYQQRRLGRDDRIYRGNDGRYYCRRSDGTTGLIVGAALGGLLGNSLGRGDSGVLATLLGAGAGAALGSSIDRGQVNCR